MHAEMVCETSFEDNLEVQASFLDVVNDGSRVVHTLRYIYQPGVNLAP